MNVLPARVAGLRGHGSDILLVAALAFVGFLAEEHLRCTVTYSINIPVEDDWMLLSDGFGRTLDPAWLVRPHNEHRMLPTKFLMWALYRFDGLDYTVAHLLNLALYGAVVTVTTALVWRGIRGLPPWLPWFGAAAMLPGSIAINIFWMIQSSVHLSMLFPLLAALLIFREDASTWKLAIGSLLSALAAWCFSSGVAASLAIAGTFCVAELTSGSRRRATGSRGAFSRVAVVLVLHAAGIGLYAAGYTRGGFPKAFPYTWAFWSYFSELISSGFGVRSVHAQLSLALLTFAALPVLLWASRSRLRMTGPQWALLAAWMSSAAALAAVAFGRARLAGPELAKSERYVELAVVMVPLSLGLWQLVIQDRSRALQATFWAAVMIVFVAGWYPLWVVEPSYQRVAARLRAGASCVERYYADPSHDAFCPEIYPWSPLGPHLVLARQLGLSFVPR